MKGGWAGICADVRPACCCPAAQWWGAALERRVEGEADGEGRQIYVLR